MGSRTVVVSAGTTHAMPPCDDFDAQASGSRAARGSAPWHDIGTWLFESSPDCVKLLDRDGYLLRINQGGRSLMEIEDLDAFIGEPWENCWPQGYRGLVRAALESARRGQVGEFQAPCPTALGTPKWWDVRTMPLRQDGELTHILCISRDVTNLMDAHVASQLAKSLAESTAQSARSAVRAKTEFVANISHELRTPLTAIGGLAHLLLDLEPTVQQRTHLQQIQVASRHAAMLMEEMLDLTEAECGNLRLHENDFELFGLLDETLTVVRQIAWSRGIELVVDMDTRLVVQVWGDAARLRNVILNCASRALRLTGEPTLELRLQVTTQGNDAVLLRCDLNRPGSHLTPQDASELIGGPTRDPSAAPASRGLGLGLSISRANAQLMGGNVGVVHDRSPGVSVWVTAALRASTPPRETAPADAVPSPSLHGRRVLVVEDDPLAREVMQHLLERAGIAVDLACDGRQGVAALQEGRFDAVLMDIEMPVMNGLDATRAIRQQLGFRTLPVIAVTGNVLEADRVDCQSAGVTDFLSKPVDATQLWRSLARWIADAGVQASTGV